MVVLCTLPAGWSGFDHVMHVLSVSNSCPVTVRQNPSQAGKRIHSHVHMCETEGELRNDEPDLS